MVNIYDGYVLKYYLDEEIFDNIKNLINKKSIIINNIKYKKHNQYVLPIGLFSNKNFILKCKWSKTYRIYNILIKKKITNNIILKDVQKKIIERIDDNIKEITKINKSPVYITLTADCSIGKTIIGIYYIIKKKIKTCIITHNKKLAYQWENKINDFTNLKVFNSQKGVSKFFDFYNNEDVIIIPFKHLKKRIFCKFLMDNFSFLIVDEQHIYNLEETSYMSDFMLNSSFNFVLSLTATPRLFNCLYFGRIIYTNDIVENFKVKNFKLLCYEVVLNKYEEFYNKEYDNNLNIYKKNKKNNKTNKNDIIKLDIYKKKVLMYDKNRIKIITKQILKDYNNNERILVLTNFVEEIDIYYNILKKKVKNIYTLYSNNNNIEYENFIKKFNNTDSYILIGTKDYLGTGIDINSLTTLHITNLFKNDKTILQCLGRISRNNDKDLHKFYFYNISSNNLNIDSYIINIKKTILAKKYKIFLLEY